MEGLAVKKFQVKDLFQKLHDTETYLLENPTKTHPTFEDVIVKKTANDPFYHKNEFNLSKTHHDINYIINKSNQEPFIRPEIDSAYIAAHPNGTIPFYPSHLSGEFIDVPKEKRVFEKLLLRVDEKPPTDDEIIQNMSKLLKDEQSALDWLRNDIDSRMMMLGRGSTTFQNYFKNLTHWLFTGILEDPNAPADPFTGTFTISTLEHLPAIHTRIIELDRLTHDQMPQLLAEFERDVITTQNRKIEEALVKQNNEEKERIEKARILNEQVEKQQQKMMELEKDKMKFFREAVELKNELRALVAIYTHTYIENLKQQKHKDKRGGVYTIHELLAANPKKDWITTTNRILLNDEISVFSSRLYAAYKALDAENNKIKNILNDIKPTIAKLKDYKLFDGEQQDDEEKLLDFEKEFNTLFNDITKKRKENSTYQLIIDFYTHTTQKGVIENEKVIHIQRNPRSSVVFVSSIFSEYIQVHKKIYNDSGEQIDILKIYTEIKEDVEQYYTFVLPEKDDVQKRYVLQINPHNTSKVLLPISLIEIPEPS